MVIKLTDSQKDLVLKTLSHFDEADIEYVILRRHEELPVSIPGTEEKVFDLDILVLPPDFNTAIRCLKEEGFRRYPKRPVQHDSEIINLLRQATNNPVYAIRFLLNSPKNLFNTVYKSAQEDATQSLSPYEKLMKRNNYSRQLTHQEQQEVKFDLKAHLAYKSPANDRLYRVDSAVEEEMLDRKSVNDNIARPSPPDELVHLICHRLYDKDGVFTDYYVNRCDELKNKVFQSNEMDEQFRELLSLIFFDASDFVYEQVGAGNYTELLFNLRSYSDY